MGASFSTAYSAGVIDVQKAYDLACDRALFEHGHDSYNGSISTTNGVVVLSDVPVPLCRAESLAKRFSSDSRMAKWGPAGALPIAPDECFSVRKSRVSMDVSDATQWRAADQIMSEHETRLKPGEFLSKVVVEKIEPVWKMETSKAAGRPVICYQVLTGDKVMSSFSRKSDAVKSAKEIAKARLLSLKRDASPSLMLPVRVVPVCTIDGNVVSSLQEDAPKLVSCRATAEISIMSISKELEVCGWFFYFWAAS